MDKQSSEGTSVPVRDRCKSYYDGLSIKTLSPRPTNSLPHIVTTVKKSKHEELPVYDFYRIYRLKTGKHHDFKVERHDGTEAYYGRTVFPLDSDTLDFPQLDFHRGSEAHFGSLIALRERPDKIAMAIAKSERKGSSASTRVRIHQSCHAKVLESSFLITVRI
jgi:hypothetical protein